MKRKKDKNKQRKDKGRRNFSLQNYKSFQKFQKILGLTIIGISLLIFAFVLIINAWVCDDAYITFRVIDNFVNGYGLVWNTAERVQTFTNPLWMFLLSGLYFFTHEIYYTSIFFSIAISLGVILVLYKINHSFFGFLICFAILVFSKAFIDYSTSGLENPITHLILGLFFFIFLKSKMSLKTLFLLSLIASIGTFSRMDTILLFLPTIIYYFLKLPKLKGAGVILMGFLPFIFWEMFCLFYYGFPFPNSYYAKLKTGVFLSKILEAGLYYFIASFKMDPLTLLTIAVSIGISFTTRKLRNVSFGIILYLIYIIKAGGDFMAGRFLTGSLFCATIVLSQLNLSFFKSFLAFIPIICIGLFLSPYPPVLSNASYGLKECRIDRGVADERAYYYPVSGLLNARRGVEMPRAIWVYEGKKIRKESPPVIEYLSVGYFGFYVGPKVYVLDRVGLSNPLLARLPAENKTSFRSGHTDRKIPYGLLKSLESKDNWICDRDLAMYYDKLSLITRGKLFDKKRLLEIVKMNLGKYDSLLDSYNSKSILEVDYSKIEPLKAQKGFSPNRIFTFKEQGIKVILKGNIYASHIKISLDSNDTYQILYVNKGVKISEQILKASFQLKGYLTFHTLDVPKEAIEKGYDEIRVIPLSGDGDYSMGDISIIPK